MLLVQHALDTAAVAECLWDAFLAPALKARLDDINEGHGRDLLVLLCGLHDIGKATPAFQDKAPELAEQVRATGLDWRPLDHASTKWHHTRAGASIMRRLTKEWGWAMPPTSDWVWPLVLGHHGMVSGAGCLTPIPGRGNAQGDAAWQAAQDDLARIIVESLGIDATAVAPTKRPRRAEQLALLGIMVMADWIASDEKHFSGGSAAGEVTMGQARERAGEAWRRLALHGGWSGGLLLPQADPIFTRFHLEGRPAQLDAAALAEEMDGPGLMILEAPMGEGKTEAAFAAAEVLARRFGADGVYVGMPTQATSDPMFTRVRDWTKGIQADLQVCLLHGKRQFNAEWAELSKQVHYRGVDEFDCEDVYGAGRDQGAAASELPAEWLLGRKRGLLAPITVGTIDQLLRAATRTRHVMLQHAGLAGRIVILDEVHAYDVYMSQFLFEALRWLADARVPVIVLSATLPPRMRADLARAYLQGALNERDVSLDDLPSAAGYPQALAVNVIGGKRQILQRSSAPRRSSVAVDVEVMAESDGPGAQVADLLVEALCDGGCALVVRNTVARAQNTYRMLREEFGDDVVLLHARLTVGERADRTQHALDLLGPPGGVERPRRLVVVATQIAEQSFDIDADILVTDLAPIDLLLQRAGRLHRHERGDDARPTRLRTPRMVVTGMAWNADAPPEVPGGSEYIYGRHLLYRTAAMVSEAEQSGWSVPADVPGLVMQVYGDEPLGPSSWETAMAAAQDDWTAEQRDRQANAKDFLLAGDDALGRPTLAGLHEQSTADLADDDRVAAVVRDGDASVEVVLVRRGDHGFLTLGGRPMGINGEAVSDPAILDEVARATVRLPASRPTLTNAALALRPLAGWGVAGAWLGHARALILDDDLSASLAGFRLTYDHELGLTMDRE